MRLNRITYRYFKGLIDFTLEPQGGNLDIFGDNEAGKTTLYDGFLYLITNKDSQNKTDFSIKTIDKQSKEIIPMLDHEVEAELTHNGKTFTLKKVFAEKWTKKRGSAQSDFTGHETTYFIDGVSKPKKDYDAFIASIIDEKTLKILTNPLYFNDDEAMKTKTDPGWKVRRNILLEISGDLNDDEVITSNKELAGLTTILNGRSTDDHRQVIKARQSKINEEMKKIPVRVDEAKRALPDITGLDQKKIEVDKATLESQLKENQSALVRLESGGEIAEKQKRLAEIETELLQLKNSLSADTDKQIQAKQKELSEARQTLMELQDNQSKLTRNLATVNANIEEVEGKLKTLREDWTQENNREFSVEISGICPTCNQSLPVEQIEEAHEKAREYFNLQKSNALAKINQRGKDLKGELQDLQAQIPLYEKNLQALNEEIASQQEFVDGIHFIITGLEKSVGDVTDNPEYTAKLKEKDSTTQAITALSANTQSAKDELQQEINRIRATISALDNNLRNIEQDQQGQARIKELQEQEKKLSAEFEKLEGELYLIEQFIKTKVNLLEEKINSKFKLARFTLFKTQVNGGLEECCETTYQGVPYGSGLNNAARINVGLDIISTLSEHYGIEMPIFVDNAESVTRLYPVKAQVIRLIVSEPDKVLRIEKPTNVKEGVLF